MQDILAMLNTLQRPALLMRAARFGAQSYRRTTHLPRLLGYGQVPRSGIALLRLVELEKELNVQRLAEESAYNLVRHIDILIAIVGEVQIFSASHPHSLTA